MKRLCLAVALSSLALLAEAQTIQPADTVFASVDGVRLEYGHIYVTGVLAGQTAAGDYYFPFGTSYVEQRKSCERLLLLAMAKPGQYQVRMQQEGSQFTVCSLVRAP